MKNTVEGNEIFDKKIEQLLGNLLRVGVIIASSIVMIGAVLFLFHHGLNYPDYHEFKFDPFSITNVGILFSQVVAFKSVAIIKLGVLLLIATPVLRVMFSVVAFLYEKDFMYVVFTLIVLAVLVFSFFS